MHLATSKPGKSAYRNDSVRSNVTLGRRNPVQNLQPSETVSERQAQQPWHRPAQWDSTDRHGERRTN
jgi:hypothetical protein